MSIILQVGEKHNHLIIKEFIGAKEIGHKHTMNMYSCECQCGELLVLCQGEIISGHVKSCGCVTKVRKQPLKYNLKNQYFGRLKVIDQAETFWSDSGKSRMIRWNCECECKNKVVVNSRALRTGMTTSCGCYQKQCVSETLTDDLTNHHFGALTVIERAGSYTNNGKRKSGVMAMWRCKCKCENEIVTTGYSLKCGDTVSCGCLKSSQAELYVEDILIENNFTKGTDYFREKCFSDLISNFGGNLRFDFVIYTKSGKYCVECQGEQHYKSVDYFGGDEMFNRRQSNDSLKHKWCAEHDYVLVEIPYTLHTKSEIQQEIKKHIIELIN